jgi:hypothetical protein
MRTELFDLRFDAFLLIFEHDLSVGACWNIGAVGLYHVGKREKAGGHSRRSR